MPNQLLVDRRIVLRPAKASDVEEILISEAVEAGFSAWDSIDLEQYWHAIAKTKHVHLTVAETDKGRALGHLMYLTLGADITAIIRVMKHWDCVTSFDVRIALLEALLVQRDQQKHIFVKVCTADSLYRWVTLHGFEQWYTVEHFCGYSIGGFPNFCCAGIPIPVHQPCIYGTGKITKEMKETIYLETLDHF